MNNSAMFKFLGATICGITMTSRTIFLAACVLLQIVDIGAAGFTTGKPYLNETPQQFEDFEEHLSNEPAFREIINQGVANLIHVANMKSSEMISNVLRQLMAKNIMDNFTVQNQVKDKKILEDTKLWQLICVTTVPEPEFVDEIGNKTVPAGRNIKLACSVKDLGSYKVAWMLFDKSAILTVHNHVITRNPRISVTHDKHRTWYLHINNVHEDDKGKYMCQINTATAKTQYGYLNVVVPPNIDDSQSSSDAIVRENANVTLSCKATGSPTPIIRWKRDDNEKIAINRSLEISEWEGETLEITRISRLGMGAYLCIASNGVPPAVSKQIKVSVDFSPMLWIPHQLVGAPLGFAVTLECYSEAHPTSLNYWTRDGGPMIHESKKYKMTSVAEKPAYKTHMTLTIYDLAPLDYGSYKCVAKNPRGDTDGTIRLYMSTPPSTSPGPLTTEPLRKGWDVLTELNNSIDGYPSSLTFHNGKTSKTGKSQLNLNEVDKSERKSNNGDRNGNYKWTSDNGGAVSLSRVTSGLLTVTFISTWIIR